MIDIGCSSRPWEADIIGEIHSVSKSGGVVLIDNNTSNFVSSVSKVSAAIIGVGTKVYVKGDPRVVATLSKFLKSRAPMKVHGSGDNECFEFPVSIDIVSHLNSYFSVTGDGAEHFGFYGICGFEMVKMTEKELRDSIVDEKNLLLFLPTEVSVSINGAAQTVAFLFDGQAPEPIDIASTVAPFARTSFPEPDNSIPYEKLVEDTIPEFLAGNMTECVLSRERVLKCSKTPGELFIDLININRSEYCLMCSFGGEAAVVSSPEMFVKVMGRLVESYPIAGTIARGATPEEDAANEKTLLSSFKDGVELAMCTDVDRNDKSRICVPGSISVLEQKLIKKYSHVMHTVDHVGGVLLPTCSGIDAFKAHMWAVTVTGSPRLNALRYITKHENTPRKWYSGAGGIFRANGDVVTCILIRFAHMVQDGTVAIRSGASLIHLSDPAEESNEVRIKAQGMVKALECPPTHTLSWLHAKPIGVAVSLPPSITPIVPFAGKILVVDYEDSFVNTVAYYLRALVSDVQVVRYNQVDWDSIDASLVVLSPGPGTPSDYDMPSKVRLLRSRGIPLLGVCLGFQGMMEADGVAVEVVPVPRHGYQRVNAKTDEGWLWADVPAGHYHSLGVKSIPPSYTALCTDGDYITGVEHKTDPVIGWQFHPESHLTATGFGHKILLHSVRRLLNHHKPGRWVFTSPFNRPGANFIDDLLKMEESGLVDAVEIGIPYTDPIADGEIIQRAYKEVLEQVPNMSVMDVIDIVGKARARNFGLPVVLMGYLNTFFTYTAEHGFAARSVWEEEACKHGIRHVIIVDLDVETSIRHDINGKLHGVKLIPVVSEMMDEATCVRLCASADYDVVYCTNYLGTTGKSGQATIDSPKYFQMISRIQASGKRILAGFGIRNAQDIDSVRARMKCDHVVVGSQYLKLMQTQSVSQALHCIFAGVSDHPLVTKLVQSAPTSEPAPRVELKVCGFGHPHEVIAAGMERILYFGFVLEPSSKRCIQPARLQPCLDVLDKISNHGYHPQSCAILKVSSADVKIEVDPRFDIVQLFCGEAPCIRSIVEALSTPCKVVINLAPEQVNVELLRFLQSRVWGLGVDQKEGGTGLSWDYGSVFAQLAAAEFSKPVFLGGGITVDNIDALIATLPQTPLVIDVSTGACSDGILKCGSRIRRLARACSPLPLYYGHFGGSFVPQTIARSTQELTTCYHACLRDPSFFETVRSRLCHIANRPTNLYEAANLTRATDGARIWLKREDSLHTGAHKINNAIYQMIIAQRMGKTRIIAETGAGQHGVAVATVCAYAGMRAVIYMGADDVVRQNKNVRLIHLLGSTVTPCTEGDRTLGSAVNAAMRDWVENIRDTHYIVGSAIGPAPFPAIVRDAQAVIGQEARAQMLDTLGVLPTAVVACVGGGSNAIGAFDAFVADHDVQLVGVEAGGTGPDKHAQSLHKGTCGVLHGSINKILQHAESGQTSASHSVSAGLDYPGVSPIHCYLHHTGRARYTSVRDDEAISALHELSHLEGILPALESSHAIAAGMQLAKTLSPQDNVIVCLSGRGDKDMDILTKYMETAEQNKHMEDLCRYLTEKDYVSTPARAVIECLLDDKYTDEAMFRFFDAFSQASTAEDVPLERPAYVLSVARDKILHDHPYTKLNGGNCIDFVGTGGDNKNAYNISTPAAIVAASVLQNGFQMLKHGNQAFTSASGSKDFLSDIGYNEELHANMHMLLHKRHPFAFLFAQQLHPSFAKFARVRKLYAKRTFFNFLGPLINPLVSYAVIGVTAERMGAVYAKVLEGKLEALILCSADGVDKISPYTTTTLWRVSKQGATKEVIDPAFALGSTASAHYLAADADMPAKGQCLANGKGLNPSKFVALLNGQEDDYTKYVVINAAAALWVSGQVTDLRAGVSIIRESLRSGTALAFFYETMYWSHHCGSKQGILSSIQKWVSFRPIRGPPTQSMKPRSFRAHVGANGLFAEAKTRSPDFPQSAQSFEGMVDVMVKEKTTVISVLSDPIFFGGSLEQLQYARLQAGENGPLILRKDFILSTDSIDESFHWGADTVLLIVRMYSSDDTLQRFIDHTRSWGTEPLVEVANEEELARAVACDAKVIGINNRDLTTFAMDKSKSIRLAAVLQQQYQSDATVVVLSGVSGVDDIRMYQEAGLAHFLIGTLFGKSSNAQGACRVLQDAIAHPIALKRSSEHEHENRRKISRMG